MRQKIMSFKDQVADQQIKWKKKNIADTRKQTWNNGIEYDHLLPKDIWEQGIWEGIRSDLQLYLTENAIQPHNMKHSLRSSWELCANLYFPVRNDTKLRKLMLGFLQKQVSSDIIGITDVELEFAFPTGDKLHPLNLLGEVGNRGTGQTSPDVAFLLTTKSGEGVILTECKFTEQSFYRCSARRRETIGNKLGNPEPERCMQKADLTCYKDICQQITWGRQYLEILRFSKHGYSVLNNCPAATNGYQLLRQQALAEGIAESGRFEFVVNSVAHDSNNNALQGCLKRSGVGNWATDWGKLFSGKAQFASWSHQEWVQFVRDNQRNGSCQEWLDYVKERYLY